jgi:transposase-like protein
MAKTSSLAAEAAPRCTACGSERIVKNGKNVCGRQQFHCRACGACRVLHPQSRETDPARKAEVLRAVATERLSLRAAQRVFGVARNPIALWLEKKPKLSHP